MKRTFVISDWFNSLSHSVRRNRFNVILYALLCLLFLVVGIAVGITVPDKAEYICISNGVLFGFLRGESGVFGFFFADFFLSVAYFAFAASMFFNRPTTFLSLAPCAYRSYILGLNVSVTVVAYTVSAVPMLFVLFVPTCIIEIAMLCMLSYGCFYFRSLNAGCSPSKADLAQYYKKVLQYILALFVVAVVKSVTLLLFGAGLVGVV